MYQSLVEGSRKIEGFLGCVGISQLLRQDSDIAVLVAAILPGCVQTVVLNAPRYPRRSAGISDSSAGRTGTPGLNGPM